MLLNKPYDVGQVVSFKLTNGDEVIAKIVEVTQSGWIIERPCTVIMSSNGVGLVQSLFSCDINKNIELQKQHVIMHAVTVQAIEDHYLETTTGIKTVKTLNKQSIML